MGRRGWSALGGVCIAGAAGLGAWTWFLAGRSLEVRDQWSSVVSGFGTLASLVVAVVALVLAGRAGAGSAGPGPAPSTGARGVHVAGDSHAPIVTGDHNRVSG